MSLIKSQDGKKWINSFIVVSSTLVGYILIRFLHQIKEWFDLESKIPFNYDFAASWVWCCFWRFDISSNSEK